MCQVTPFTYPCCKRIYVLVEKLQNCPADWPKSKCPQELCIQVINIDTAQVKQSSSGTCWRCKATADGKSGRERESMRPEIDTAIVVEGLEELHVNDRRRRVEAGGNCWYCGARHGCSNCGVKKRSATTDPTSPSWQEKKPKFGNSGYPRKKAKGDGGRGIIGKPSPLKPRHLFTGFSQPAFHQTNQVPTPSQYLPTPNPAQDGFLAFQNNGLPRLPTRPEATPDTWQTGPPYSGYASFWENYNAVQGPQFTAAGNNQMVQDIKANVGYDLQNSGPGIVMDPGDTARHDQMASGNLLHFGNTVLYSGMDQFNNCYSSSGNDGAQAAPQAKPKSEGDPESNIDPALTQEGRGQTP